MHASRTLALDALKQLQVDKSGQLDSHAHGAPETPAESRDFRPLHVAKNIQTDNLTTPISALHMIYVQAFIR